MPLSPAFAKAMDRQARGGEVMKLFPANRLCVVCSKLTLRLSCGGNGGGRGNEDFGKIALMTELGRVLWIN